MATLLPSLVRRNRTDNPLTAWSPFGTWDPFQSMARDIQALASWDPLTPYARLTPEMSPQDFNPQFDVKETREGYVFKADVPGVAESDLDVNFQGNKLRISGKRESEKEEKTDTYYACQRSYGSFARLFTLPDNANSDKARAEMKDGVLTVMIPKTPEAPMKKVDVRVEKK